MGYRCHQQRLPAPRRGGAKELAPCSGQPARAGSRGRGQRRAHAWHRRRHQSAKVKAPHVAPRAPAAAAAVSRSPTRRNPREKPPPGVRRPRTLPDAPRRSPAALRHPVWPLAGRQGPAAPPRRAPALSTARRSSPARDQSPADGRLPRDPLDGAAGGHAAPCAPVFNVCQCPLMPEPRADLGDCEKGKLLMDCNLQLAYVLHPGTCPRHYFGKHV